MKRTSKILLIVACVFTLFSVFFGGKHLSSLSLSIHQIFKGPAEKAEESGLAAVGSTLRFCSQTICFIPDSLAVVSDKIPGTAYSLIEARIKKEEEAVNYIRNMKEIKESTAIKENPQDTGEKEER